MRAGFGKGLACAVRGEFGKTTPRRVPPWHSGNDPARVLKSIDCMPVKTSSASPMDATAAATPPSPGPTRVGFVSLGCPKNLVDSEVMMGLLERAGAKLVSGADDADVIVVNTCSFIASAQQESVNTILEMAKQKTGGRARKLVVAGCLVERFRSEIRQKISEVAGVVGTGGLVRILV